MAEINRGSGDLEANSLVTVACTSLAMLQDKLEIAALRLHLPALHLLVQWWPMLLIIAGVIMLFTSWNARVAKLISSTPESRPPVSQGQREFPHER